MGVDNRWDSSLVSVIMPAYRAAAYLERTVASVVAQTYPHWELLIADDCSPDNTREVIRRLAESDSRITLLELERNGGPAAARNAALNAAKGRWLAFLDSDDLWLSNKLSAQLAFAEEQSAALTFTGFRRITADESTVGRYVGVPSELSFRQLLGNTAIATSTVIVDRQMTGEFRMKDVYYDDFACWLDILRAGHRAAGLNVDLMRYRVLESSVSRNKGRSAKKIWQQLRQTEKLGFFAAGWYFGNYAVRGYLKYLRF